jgi:hypothetical protein
VLLRRIAALLTAVSMLHLSAASLDAACATHDAPDREAAAHAMPMDDHGTMASHESAEPGMDAAGDSCEIPVQPGCCTSQVGCNTIGVVSPVERTTRRMPAERRLRVVLNDAPPSFVTAPEPPPPKA